MTHKNRLALGIALFTVFTACYVSAQTSPDEIKLKPKTTLSPATWRIAATIQILGKLLDKYPNLYGEFGARYA